jgi:hypothetical protein
VLVGSSSRDIRLTGRFNFTGDPVPEPGKEARLHIGLPLKTLLDDASGKAVLERYVGAYLGDPQIEMVWETSLEDIAKLAPGILTPELLQAINDNLAKV